MTPEDVGLERVELERDRRWRAGGERRRRPRGARGRAAARPATSSLLNAGAAILVAGGAHDLAAGVERARRGDRLGRGARACSSGWRAGPASWPPDDYAGLRMSKLDELVGAAREDVERRKRQVPVEDLRERGRHPERLAAVQRGAGAPGALADRRVQAPLAERRRDRRRGDRRRGRRRLRARRRRGALGAHRRAQLRRLARRPARGPRGLRACRSCARTSSSTRTSSTRPRSTAPTRCC